MPSIAWPTPNLSRATTMKHTLKQYADGWTIEYDSYILWRGLTREGAENILARLGEYYESY